MYSETNAGSERKSELTTSVVPSTVAFKPSALMSEAIFLIRRATAAPQRTRQKNSLFDPRLELSCGNSLETSRLREPFRQDGPVGRSNRFEFDAHAFVVEKINDATESGERPVIAGNVH
jgi:hypothetical protein